MSGLRNAVCFLISICIQIWMVGSAYAIKKEDKHSKQACFVVSGLEKDGQGSFRKHQGFIKNPVINGVACTVVKSWKALDDQINLLDPSKKVLIVQQAHGSPGGTAHCDAGDATPGEISSYLKKFSSTHPTGFIANTCYSGDLLTQKLATDEKLKAEKKSLTVVKNLCMIVSSPPEHASQVSRLNWLEGIKTGDNLKDYFVKYPPSPLSLTSAGLWSVTGVSKAFADADSFSDQDVLKAYKKIKKVMRHSKQGFTCRTCIEEGVIENEAILSGNVCNEEIEELQALRSAVRTDDPSILIEKFSLLESPFSPQEIKDKFKYPLDVVNNGKKFIEFLTDQENGCGKSKATQKPLYDGAHEEEYFPELYLKSHPKIKDEVSACVDGVLNQNLIKAKSYDDFFSQLRNYKDEKSVFCSTLYRGLEGVPYNTKEFQECARKHVVQAAFNAYFYGKRTNRSKSEADSFESNFLSSLKNVQENSINFIIENRLSTLNKSDLAKMNQEQVKEILFKQQKKMVYEFEQKVKKFTNSQCSPQEKKKVLLSILAGGDLGSPDSESFSLYLEELNKKQVNPIYTLLHDFNLKSLEKKSLFDSKPRANSLDRLRNQACENFTF